MSGLLVIESTALEMSGLLVSVSTALEMSGLLVSVRVLHCCLVCWSV